jgi:hypothetical protein
MSANPRSDSDQPVWKRELAWATGLIAMGLILLPVCVYWVGQVVVGEYAPDRGLWDMLLHIWSDSARGGALAWMLVLGPYALAQVLRAIRCVRRSGGVNYVKDSAADH